LLTRFEANLWLKKAESGSLVDEDSRWSGWTFGCNARMDKSFARSSRPAQLKKPVCDSVIDQSPALSLRLVASLFASSAYRQLLAQHGLVASMSRKGNCYDNAFIESFWSSLKYEVVYHQRFATFAQARSAVFNYIETFYNRTRLHSSLAYRSPIAFESQLNQPTN
jgi:putative transposase